MKPAVNIVLAEPSPFAAVVIRTTFADLPGELQSCYDRVQAAIDRGDVTPAGHRIAVFRRLGPPGTVEASIGVQVAAPFEDMGGLRCLNTPAGRAATAQHDGGPQGLASARTAILEWADEVGVALTRVSWEIYQSGSADVYHLLDIEPSVVDY